MRSPMNHKDQPSRRKLEGKILILLEHQTPRSFGATAPQFSGVFAFGGTRQAALRHLKNAILDELEEESGSQQTQVQKAQQFSAKEAENLRAKLSEQASPNQVSISSIEL